MELISAYQQACSDRDKDAHLEQNLEDRIFSTSAVHSTQEIDSLMRDYRIIKMRRMEASLKAARLFMQLSPKDRHIATEQWKKSAEGVRKAEGSGVRGD